MESKFAYGTGGILMLKKDKKGKNIGSWMNIIYQLSPVKRSVMVWLSFQVILWFSFGISYITHQGAWLNVAEIDPVTAAVGGWWSTFLFIVLSNFIICLLIFAGNVFVRFGGITPGLVVLIIQGVMIGWLAGSNGFEVPFVNVQAANMQYLRIGLWETTAYALVCAVTLPKSLLIAETFPAKEWSQSRKWKEIGWSITEKSILLLGGIVLITAAIIETFAIIG